MPAHHVWVTGEGNREGGKAERAVAAALGYDPERDAAPRVLAAGKGGIAEKILAVARDHDIPVVEDETLAAALAALDIGAMIPVELYAVVAEILVYVYRLRGYLPETLSTTQEQFSSGIEITK